MSSTKFKGTEVQVSGNLPAVGSKAPEFSLIKQDLSEVTLASLKGKRVVLNIFPSVDTGVCATSVRKFNVEASKLSNTVVLCVSKDLPFAFKRFCGAEGIESVVTGSAFQSDAFEATYGVKLLGSPLKGLMARSVVVVDENGVVTHSQLVPEITEEPNYDAAIASLK